MSFSVDLFFSLVNTKCHKGDVLKKRKKRKKRKHQGFLESLMQNFLCFAAPTQGKCKYFLTVGIFPSCLRILLPQMIMFPTRTTEWTARAPVLREDIVAGHIAVLFDCEVSQPCHEKFQLTNATQDTCIRFPKLRSLFCCVLGQIDYAWRRC